MLLKAKKFEWKDCFAAEVYAMIPGIDNRLETGCPSLQQYVLHQLQYFSGNAPHWPFEYLLQNFYC